MKRGNISTAMNITECNNLLFFAQLINELLFDYSIPSNRVSTLNSHYLCIDALNTISTIENNGVPEGTLKPIVEELFRELSKDIAFSSRNINPLQYFLKMTSNGSYKPTQNPSELNFNESKNVVNAIHRKYFASGQYRKWLEADIKRLINNNQESDQQDLFRLTKSYLTELINGRYSDQIISIVANRLFYPKSNAEVTLKTVDDFFDTFSFETRKYTVLMCVPKNKAKFVTTNFKGEIVSTWNPRGNSGIEKKFLEKKSSELYISSEIEDAQDPFSAAKATKRMLVNAISVHKLFDHNFVFDMTKIRIGVYDENNWFSVISEETSPVQRAKTPSKEIISQKKHEIVQAVSKAWESGNVYEMFALFNAISSHALSIESDNEQNQLLDLWSIFETILDISNNHTNERIHQICLYLVPILKRKYIYSLFEQLQNDIRNYSEEWYERIIQSASDSFEAIKKLCEFVLLDERKEERISFLNACSDFPLLKERISYYNQKLSRPIDIFNFVEKHSERVRWQVMRIYRNRNLIIHNGEASPYLRLLVENLHSYVDDFLDYVIHAKYTGMDQTTMCQELFAKECEWQAHFQSRQAQLTPELINEMLEL